MNINEIYIECINKYNRIIDTIKTVILHYYLEQILNHGMKHINIITNNTGINEIYKTNEMRALNTSIVQLD